MPIPSLTFLLIFLPAGIFLHFLFSFSRGAQNGVLLLASLLFYAFGQTSCLLALGFSIAWNYAMGIAIAGRRNKGGGRVLTGIAIAANALLFTAFLLTEQGLAFLPQPFGAALAGVTAAMPLGLAWYTLQAVGYCFDVYRGDVPAEHNPVYLGLYLGFFVNITAGPLVDYAVMRRQMSQRKCTAEKMSIGLCRFVIGLAKKLLLADQLSYLVNYIFTQAAMDNAVVQLPVSMAWFGVLAFALQLYYELSGFADMAVGLGGVFGFDLPENFRYPFSAVNMTDFWRRWNITPLRWFRKYFYGSMATRESRDREVLNLLLVWVVFALWTGGFGWTCLLWGVWNFLLLLAEHSTGYASGIPGRFLKRTYTLMAVSIGFVLLRSPTLYNAGQYFLSLLWLNNNRFWSALIPVFLKEYWLPIGFGILFATPLAEKWHDFAQRSSKRTLFRVARFVLYPICITGLLVLCITFILQNTAIHTPIY